MTRPVRCTGCSHAYSDRLIRCPACKRPAALTRLDYEHAARRTENAGDRLIVAGLALASVAAFIAAGAWLVW